MDHSVRYWKELSRTIQTALDRRRVDDKTGHRVVLFQHLTGHKPATWSKSDRLLIKNATNDVIVEKVINIYHNWCNQMLWSLLGQFPNCRPNPSAVVVT